MDNKRRHCCLTEFKTAFLLCVVAVRLMCLLRRGKLMKIDTLKIKSFRGYCGEFSINFNKFTALVGKNDVGKSTIMEALDIFFNDGKVL